MQRSAAFLRCLMVGLLPAATTLDGTGVHAQSKTFHVDSELTAGQPWGLGFLENTLGLAGASSLRATRSAIGSIDLVGRRPRARGPNNESPGGRVLDVEKLATAWVGLAEQGAGIVLGLHSDAVERPDLDGKWKAYAELAVLRYRQGRTGTMELHNDDQQTRFSGWGGAPLGSDK